MLWEGLHGNVFKWVGIFRASREEGNAHINGFIMAPALTVHKTQEIYSPPVTCIYLTVVQSFKKEKKRKAKHIRLKVH